MPTRLLIPFFIYMMELCSCPGYINTLYMLWGRYSICRILHIKVDACMQVIIGCDGVNSVVASIVGLNSSRHFSTCAIRGVTHYQTLHPFGTAFYLFDKDGVRLGLLPINHNDVYWFLTRKLTSTGTLFTFSSHQMSSWFSAHDRS